MPKKTRKRSSAGVSARENVTDESRFVVLGTLVDEALESWHELDQVDDFRQLQGFQKLSRCSARERACLVLTSLDLLDDMRSDSPRQRPSDEGKVVCLQRGYAVESILALFLKRQLDFDDAGLWRLVAFVAREYGAADGDRLWIVFGTLRATARYAQRQALSEEVTRELRGLKSSLVNAGAGATVLRRFDDVVAADADVLDAGEPWTEAVQSALSAMADPTGWWELLRHVRKASGGRPSARWVAGTEKRIDALGAESFVERLAGWLRLAGARRGRAARPAADVTGHVIGGGAVSRGNVDLLRGLVWCCAGRRDGRLQAALGELGEACFRKRSARRSSLTLAVGNACVYALATDGDVGAFAQFERLRLVATSRSVHERVVAAQERIAADTGVEIDDLEELMVPDCGLNEVGRSVTTFGEWTGELTVLGAQRVELSWRHAGGRLQKSPPAAVRRAFPDGVSEIEESRRELVRMLPAQQRRLESLLLSERSWDLETWRQRYLVQPLVGTFGRRLIWSFQLPTQLVLGIWYDGHLVDVRGDPIYGFTEETRVRLWHPIGCSREGIGAWREWLAACVVVQPFKQAHRELYVLTEAELATETYSNRFAAHILKQHQFAGLCRARGWQFQMAGHWSHERLRATRELPRWGLRAEFWVDAIHADEAYSPSGVGLYLSTDQVRFYDANDAGHAEPVALTEVPALVFTEVMRDVDLFVGVASIGNDPGWTDRGDDAPYAAYWHDFSFGALGATARTRREVLEELLPRLKIGGRCRIDDRFLIVRGDLRTYKIHLGSANILMAPNDQYLCIVEDRDQATARGVRLPFEGDSTLSMILSKAFLLAADAKIRDRTILSQIRES